MLRFFFKKKRIKRQRKLLIFLYKKLTVLNSKLLIPKINLYSSFVFISLPKRQQHFNFFDIQNFKQVTLTSGFLLKTIGRKAKFFKRTPKNITGIVLQLKKNYSYFFKYIYLLYIKNFNKRQFLMFKKIFELISPKVEYFLHKKSFIPRFIPKRRIKKKIWKLVNKQ